MRTESVNCLNVKILSTESDDPGGSDRVDAVRGQWARERPELDTSPVAVVARMGRATRYLDRGLEETFSAWGLTRESFDVLATLRRSGSPYRLSPTALYRASMRTSGAMTNRLHRLEGAGLVERHADPADGRGQLVGLTIRGRELADKVAPAHLDNERRLLAALTNEEQQALAGLLRKLLTAFEREERQGHGVE